MACSSLICYYYEYLAFTRSERYRLSSGTVNIYHVVHDAAHLYLDVRKKPSPEMRTGVKSPEDRLGTGHIPDGYTEGQGVTACVLALYIRLRLGSVPHISLVS